MILAGIVLLALPFVKHLKKDWGEPPTVLSPASDQLQAGQRVCIGGVAREHEPAVPSPLAADERILWCHAIVKKYPGPELGKGPPATRTLKAATWFRLVDDVDPDQYVLVDGRRLFASMVTLDHDPEHDHSKAELEHRDAQRNPLLFFAELLGEMASSMSSANRKIIRSGDRLWISGRLRQGREGLYLGRWASVDNVRPDQRFDRDQSTARMVAFGVGGLLLVLGLWRVLSG